MPCIREKGRQVADKNKERGPSLKFADAIRPGVAQCAQGDLCISRGLGLARLTSAEPLWCASRSIVCV